MTGQLLPTTGLPPEWRIARPLGTSQVRVPRLGLGLRGITRDATANRRMLVRAHALGFRHFDAAPSYGFGSVEVQLGQAEEELGRGALVLSTKAGRLVRRPSRLRQAVHSLSHLTLDHADLPGARRVVRRFASVADHGTHGGRGGTEVPHPAGRQRGSVAANVAADLEAVCAYSYDGVMRSFEESLDRLGTDHVEIVYLHDPEVHVGTAMRHGFRALEALRRQGAIGAIGVSLNDGAKLARFVESVDLDVVLLAGRYSLLDQSGLDTLFDVVARRGIGLVVGGVFNGGLLAEPDAIDKYNWGPVPAGIRDRARQIHSVCAEHGVDARAAALQFAFAHPAISTLLLGPASELQLVESFELLTVDIPADLWPDLRHRRLLRDDAPVPTTKGASVG